MRIVNVPRTVGLVAALAVAAAGLVTLVSGSDADATTPSDAVTYVPASPCRLVDTRPDDQIGGRATPLGPTEVHSVVGRGAAGGCTGSTAIPATATALQLNVTAVGATEPTYLTIFPTGEARPNASSLNPAPGQPPVPNAVTATLGAGGQFDVYNHAGTVHLVVDVVGFYTEHDHDDRYYTKSQVEALTASPLQRTIIVSGAGTDTENGQRFVDAVAEVADAGGSSADPWRVHLEPGVFLLPGPVTLPPGTIVTGKGAVIDVGTHPLMVTENDLADIAVLGTSTVIEVQDRLAADGISVSAGSAGSGAAVTVIEGAVATFDHSGVSVISAGPTPRQAIDAMSYARVRLVDSDIFVSGDDTVAIRSAADWTEIVNTRVSAAGVDTVGVYVADGSSVIDGATVDATVSLRVDVPLGTDVDVTHSDFSGAVDSYVTAPEVEIEHTVVDGGVIGSATCTAVTSDLFGTPGFYATACPAPI